MKALGQKNYIIGIDNFYSSNREVLEKLNIKNFHFIEDDIINMKSINEKIDIIFNLACPASPPKYQANPIFTMDTNYIGTKNILELARENNAIVIQSSTSEIYGDPLINPQINADEELIPEPKGRFESIIHSRTKNKHKNIKNSTVYLLKL